MFFNHSQPDYDDIEDENHIKLMERGKSGKGKDNKKYGEFNPQRFNFTRWDFLPHIGVKDT
jgi:hypothetical protein